MLKAYFHNVFNVITFLSRIKSQIRHQFKIVYCPLITEYNEIDKSRFNVD